MPHALQVKALMVVSFSLQPGALQRGLWCTRA
jgi:hypothetical protein